MDSTNTLARSLAEEALAPFLGNDPRLVQEVARLVGYEGYTVAEAAEQLGVDADSALATLAGHGGFQALVDSYQGAATREMAAKVGARLRERVQAAGDGIPEIAEGEARAMRAVQALHKELKAGERERTRQREKSEARRERQQKLAVSTHRVNVTVEDVEGEFSLEGAAPAPPPVAAEQEV